MLKKTLISFILIIISISIAIPSHAAITLDDLKETGQKTLKPTGVSDTLVDALTVKQTQDSTKQTPDNTKKTTSLSLALFFQTAAGTLLKFAAPIAFVMILIAGTMFSLASGNKEMQTKASKMLIMTVVGIVVIMLSFTIITIVTDVMIEFSAK